MANAVVFQGNAEIKACRFGVADVEIAVRLGREAGDDASAPRSGPEVRRHDAAYEAPSVLGGGIIDMLVSVRCHWS